MGDGRQVTRTRWPGIFRVSKPGRADRFMVSYRVPGVGQRTKTLATITDAKTFQGSVRDPAHLRQLVQLERGKVSLGAYFDTFMERRRNLTASTRDRYEGIGRLYVKPGRLGRLQVAAITRDDVEDWITDLVRRGVGSPTIDKAHRVLRAVLEAATAEGKTLANPAKRVSTPEQTHRDPFFLTAEQVDRIANQVPKRHRALVYFLAYTGARIGEAAALRVANLDLPPRGRRATFVENSTEVAGRKVLGMTKTKRVRTVDLSEPLCAELAAHLEAYGPRTASGEIDQRGFMFRHAGGGPIRQNNWRARIFQPASVRSRVTRPGPTGSLEPPRVHDLRHTAASLAAQVGYTLYEVKDMLGHSTIKTTADLYLHLFPDAKREKADLLGAMMSTAAAAREVQAEVIRLADRAVAAD